MKEKSILIIGAGLAGLSAGCYARMNGYNTRILEKHNIPGGLCTSWKRKGYVMDGCIHYLMHSRSGPYNRFYSELGATQGRRMIDNDEFVRIECSDGKTWIVYADIDRLQQNMKELSPGDAGVINELCHKARLFTNYEFPVEKPMEFLGIPDMIKMLKKFPVMMAMGKYGNMSMQKFATRFSDPFLRKVFPMMLEDIPEMPMISILSSLACLHTKNYGWPVEGSLEFSKSIEQRYRSLGGKIQYRSCVEKVLVEHDRAVGVRLNDGKEYFADLIISAADGHTTIYKMLDGKYVNSKIEQRYRECDIYGPFIQISLGIACDLSEEPHFIVLETDNPVKVGNETRDWITVKHYCYDDTLAPEGKSILTASFIFNDYDYWKRLYEDKERYEKEKEELAHSVIDYLTVRFPVIKGKIEVVDVATPVTYERYTGNWKGSYMGWKGNPVDTGNIMKRTLPGLDHFYMAGQWVFPGGGVPGAIASGRHLIQILCKKDKKRFEATVP